MRSYFDRYDASGEPLSLLPYHNFARVGAPTGREAMARVLSSPRYKAWERRLSGVDAVAPRALGYRDRVIGRGPMGVPR